MPQTDPFIGKRLAHYRIERLLGRGGMGQVYYGWDVSLDRPVAIKVIDARLQNDQSYARRFVQEARAIASWEHPGILQIYYASDQDGLYYYAMEFIDGVDLDKLIEANARKGKAFSADEVLHITGSVADALDYAHSKGMIHRDVKPANILISRDARVMLTDFGLAMDVSLGTMGEVFGTPRYIAPEQARNSAQAVPASDLYALGVIIYQMLTGSVPFDDPSPAVLAVQHITAEPPRPRDLNPELSEDIERVVLKSLKKDPAQRYPTGRALMVELENALLHREAAPTPATLRIQDAGAQGEVPPPTRARLSLTQRVAEHAPARPETTAAGLPVQSPRLADRLRNLSWPKALWIGGGFALVVAVCALLAGLALTRLGSALAGRPSTTDNPLVGTPLLQATSVGGNLPTEPPAPPQGGEAAAPEQPAPAATQAADPGSGAERRFAILYNKTSLYLINQSGRDVPLSYFAFERLNKDGKPDKRMDGWYLGQIYNDFRDGYCVVIREFSDKHGLQPEECQDRELVVRTPTEEQDVIFWTNKEGAKEFRVLWRDQEVARCPTGEGQCEVILP